MSVGTLVALIFILAVFSALFSAIETALFSLRGFQIKRLHERNPTLSHALERLMENPRRLLSVIALSDATVNVPLIILCLILIREHVAEGIPFSLAAVGIFAVVVLLCDLGPKVLALGRPFRIAKIGVAVLAVIMPAFDPVARLLQQLSEKVANAMTPERFQPRTHLSEEELETLVQLSAEEGALDPAEGEMIQEIIKLRDKTVKDCMTPRVDMFAFADDLTNEDVIAKLKATRHRRVPVFGDTPDDVLGIIDVKSFLLNPAEHYTEAMIPPSFVPETMKALDLLRSFLRHRQGMAVIVDEFGGTEGVITLSDIIEEIISDAVPAADRELYIEPAGEGSVIASGRTRLDDLAELGFHLETEGVDTLGGLIFNRLGSVPKAGTKLEVNDLCMSVRRSSRKGVEEVFIARGHETEETPL